MTLVAAGRAWLSKWVRPGSGVLASLVCALTSFNAGAQGPLVGPPADPPTAAQGQTSKAAVPDAVAQTNPQSQPPRVLFIEPNLDAESVQGLHEAALAQFALIRAEIVFKVADSDASLAGQMTRAEALAEEQHAIAVFWIEEQANGTWLLHMMDSERERVVIRAVDASDERRPAAIEAVAVMVRESTRALIASEPPPEPEPEPRKAPSPMPPKNLLPAGARPWRLWVGYVAEDFASEVTWQHCVALGASWHGLQPWYAGLRFLLTPALSPTAPIAIHVQRYPFQGALGYRYRIGRLALDGGLGLSVDLLRNRAEGVGAPVGGLKITPETDQTRVLLALEPHLRGELQLSPFLAVFADLGVGILLNPFSYLSRQSISQTESVDTILLRPNPVRPAVGLGIAFYP